MKARTLVFSLAGAAVFLIPSVSLAQGAPEPAAEKHPAKPRTVAALVSADARSFDSKQGQWTVSNPEALAGYQNQRVKVKYLISTETSRAKILAVKSEPASTQNSAYKSDSAYHR
jgi:hypothetical protein